MSIETTLDGVPFVGADKEEISDEKSPSPVEVEPAYSWWSLFFFIIFFVILLAAIFGKMVIKD